MKVTVKLFFNAIIYLLGIVTAFAGPNPPSPGFKKPPPPPGLPINEDILILLIIAVLYALIIIVRYKTKFTSNSKFAF